MNKNNNNNKLSSDCDCNLLQSKFPLFAAFTTYFSPPRPCHRFQSWESLLSCPSSIQELYEGLLNQQDSARPADIHQIDLDIDRTFPTHTFFDSHIKQALRRILICISIYDPSVGYVQGMNFLVGSILWHASEVKTFWLMTTLLSKYELRLNYTAGLRGLTRHSKILELILFEQYPSFVCYLNDNRADIGVYITEWCFTLFAKVVPIDEMGKVLDEFLKKGWIFFYKLVIAILLRLKDRLINLKDPSDILTIIKPSEVYKRGNNFLRGLALPNEKISWSVIFEEAEQVKLSRQYIEYLISSMQV